MFVPVHLAKNVLFAEIVGVLLGNATVGFDESYQVIVDGELQPVAVKVVVPETVKFDGVAVGLVGAGVEFTVTLPETLFDRQPLAFLTIKIYEILEPDAPPSKLTVIGETGKEASVTVVTPDPEIEYNVGVPVVAV